MIRLLLYLPIGNTRSVRNYSCISDLWATIINSTADSMTLQKMYQVLLLLLESYWYAVK